MVMLGMTAVGALLLMYLMYQPASTADQDQDESTPEPPPPPRNFTIEQLHVSIFKFKRGVMPLLWHLLHTYDMYVPVLDKRQRVGRFVVRLAL